MAFTFLPLKKKGRQGRYQSQYGELTEGISDSVKQRSKGADPQKPCNVHSRSTRFPSWDTDNSGIVASCSIINDRHHQWGKIDDNDACVLKFITRVTQNGNCRLDSMSVRVCFTEHGPDNDVANTVLELLHGPFPTSLIHGPLRHEHFTRDLTVSPQVGVSTVNVEGGSYQQTRVTEFLRYWTYTCNMRVDKHDRRSIALWRWNADPGDPHVQHIGALYSAVVLAHPSKPFWIGCDIALELHSFRNGVLRRLKARRRDAGGGYVFRELLPTPSDRDLKELVETLNEDISKLIMSGSAVE